VTGGQAGDVVGHGRLSAGIHATFQVLWMNRVLVWWTKALGHARGMP